MPRAFTHSLAGARLVVLFFAGLGWGCASPQIGQHAPATPNAPPVLLIEAGAYERAFDAAVDAARAYGMAAALRDRRSGVIETEPEFSPSMLVPWHPARVSPARAVEATLSMQRHRARIEFRAIEVTTDDAENAAMWNGEPPASPARFVLDRGSPDLTTHAGPVEMIVIVEVERSHSPGLQRSAWTRRGMNQARIIDPETNRPLPARLWSSVGRDTALEQRLHAAIGGKLSR